MNLSEIQQLGRQLLIDHGLYGWSIEWDRRSRNRAGQCNHRRQAIILGHHVWSIEANATYENARNTILHEIAHALVGPGHGHDHVWWRKAIAIGCNGNRQHDMEVKWRYHGGCKCGPSTFGRQRLAGAMRGATCTTCNAEIKWKKVS